MSSPRILPALAALLLAACTTDSPVAPVRNLPPLEARLWYVQSADGQQLPALIAHRLVEGSLEQTFLDSATVQITADGRWVRRFWMQRLRAGQRVASEASQRVGTWSATPESYLFIEEPAGRTFELGGPRVYSFREILELVLAQTHRDKMMMPLPFGLAKVIGGLCQTEESTVQVAETRGPIMRSF